MTEIRVVQDDITRLAVEAVVNAANVNLQHGGGVALAIARAGGEIVQIESDRWVEEHGPLESGVAAVTTAGDMPANVVVHITGPVFREGQENARLLRTAVETALDAAAGAGARSVALPAISAGIYGYPLADATRVITGAVANWCAAHPDALDQVLLVGYDRPTAEAFVEALEATDWSG